MRNLILAAAAFLGGCAGAVTPDVPKGAGCACEQKICACPHCKGGAPKCPCREFEKPK